MKKKISIDKVLFIYFLIIVGISLIVGKNFANKNEQMYKVMFFYIIIPISAFITNFLSSLYGRLMKYLFPILYGISGTLIPMMVFKGIGYESMSLYYGLIPAIPGFMIGTFIKILKFKKYGKIKK